MKQIEEFIVNQNRKLDSLQNFIFRKMQIAILQGDISLDQRIKQEDLAKSMNVSRMPVRKAFKLLEEEGLLILDAEKGARVNIDYIVKVEEIFFIQKILEPQAVSLAMSNISDSKIKTLEAINMRYAESVKANNCSQRVDINIEFHLFLYSLCENKYLYRIIKDMWDMYPLYIFNLLPGRSEKAIQEHGLIVNALKNREIDEAAILLKYHIEKSQQAYNKRYRELAKLG